MRVHNAEALRGQDIAAWREAKAALDDETWGKWRRVRNGGDARSICGPSVTGNIWRNAKVNEPHCIIVEWHKDQGLAYQLGRVLAGVYSAIADHDSLSDAKAAAQRLEKWGA